MKVLPVAVMAMDPAIAGQVFPDDLRRRLEPTVRLVPPVAPGLPSAETLAEARVLLTGWGCPPLPAALMSLAPRLGAVVHAAGSVKALLARAEGGESARDGRAPEGGASEGGASEGRASGGGAPVPHGNLWEAGVLVSQAADANAGPVADFTLALITLAAKGALHTAARYAEGPPPFAARTGADRCTVGLIGASRIGRKVAAGLRRSAAGYRVLVHDPYLSPAEADSLGVQQVELGELCRLSRVVSVHAPELPSTHHLLNAAMLALVPDGGTVINTARGSLIDTEALTRECASGRLAAHLDVTDPEPLPPGHQLLSLPNVQVTPHLAGAQGSEVRRLGAFAVAETERFLAGQPLLGQVRREELGRLA